MVAVVLIQKRGKEKKSVEEVKCKERRGGREEAYTVLYYVVTER
jgi:hypothetical protein